MSAAAPSDASGLVDLRTTLGAAVVDRDVVRVTGPDALAYLQGQLSQDVAALAAGAAAWSFVLQPTGKVDAWVRVIRTADDEVLLDVDGGYGEALLTRLRRFLLRTKADVDPLAWRAVAVRGPGAADAADAGGGADDLRVPVAWPGLEGVDVLGPGVGPPPGVPVVDRAAVESLRIRAGVPAMGAELTEATIPAEAGQQVIAASVSFTKGCFTGQELVARIDSRGGHVPRLVRGLDVPGDTAPRTGDPVAVDGDEVGRVTSVAPRPGGGSVALALLGRKVVPPVAARVDVAGDAVPATVVDLPFDPDR
jgi:folate-binding protein YgfZ